MLHFLFVVDFQLANEVRETLCSVTPGTPFYWCVRWDYVLYAFGVGQMKGLLLFPFLVSLGVGQDWSSQWIRTASPQGPTIALDFVSLEKLSGISPVNLLME